jgi:ribonuclease-3
MGRSNSYPDVTELERTVGYCFSNKQLLLQALTHSSFQAKQNNERLEFLGDAVLELCVSMYLFEKFPAAKEGELTKRRAVAVCGRSLAAAAQKIDLGKYILLGQGEEAAGGREKQSVLENAMEALLGAVYLDGGLLQAKQAVWTLVLKDGNFSINDPESPNSVLGRDYKSYLQETVQAGEDEKIIYETYRTEGPPHDSIFYVRVYVGERQAGSGSGKSKKEAEQQAAKEALYKMYKIKI